MVKLGMKLGQRKKLIKYINYLEDKNKKEIFIDIDKNSSREKAKEFLAQNTDIMDKIETEIREKLAERAGMESATLFCSAE